MYSRVRRFIAIFKYRLHKIPGYFITVLFFLSRIFPNNSTLKFGIPYIKVYNIFSKKNGSVTYQKAHTRTPDLHIESTFKTVMHILLYWQVKNRIYFFNFPNFTFFCSCLVNFPDLRKPNRP